jgi:outer membrane protein OmpA-like peptidoglycan-associated protein
LIKKDTFGNPQLRNMVTFLEKLSSDRAEAVRRALVEYAGHRGYSVDRSQIRTFGASMLEPIAVLPPPGASDEEFYQKNRRVEFRLIRVSGGEATQAEGFDY